MIILKSLYLIYFGQTIVYLSRSTKNPAGLSGSFKIFCWAAKIRLEHPISHLVILIKRYSSKDGADMLKYK